MYYNDTFSIYSVALDGTDKWEEFSADTTDGYIYGSALCQGTVLYCLHQSPNLTEKEEKLETDIAIEEDPKQFPVRQITLDQNTLLLAEGETVAMQVYPLLSAQNTAATSLVEEGTAALQVYFVPVYTTDTLKKANRALAWKSSNPAYASVSKNGKVNTKKAGKGHSVTITANSTDGSNKKKSVRIRIE